VRRRTARRRRTHSPPARVYFLFLRGFAIHGYPSVPPWPASHGCVRVPMWVATRVFALHRYGFAIWIYD